MLPSHLLPSSAALPPPPSSSSAPHDFLALGEDARVLRLLAAASLKAGDTGGGAAGGERDGRERVLFSDVAVKINRKGQHQQRALVVTTRALYNMGAQAAGRAVKRRIALAAITHITVSALSNELVVHVPSEYDYRYSCGRKIEAIDAVLLAVAQRLGAQLDVAVTEDASLKDHTRTAANQLGTQRSES